MKDYLAAVISTQQLMAVGRKILAKDYFAAVHDKHLTMYDYHQGNISTT